ncbi:MAG TPA: L-threonylcarbamoyladenylate synthase [Chloroflexota bacterium]|nr:L-threonylcarbamoyladenylate synthase [Chloroflexota bacterium]
MANTHERIARWTGVPEIDQEIAQRAATIIRRGGLVVYPTDTVYGVGCDPLNEAAIRRVYEVKGRPDEKAIIWLVCTIEDARAWCVVDSRAERLAARFWPGGLTIILPRRSPSASGLNTLGIRAPAHAAALAIIGAAGGRVATTSANKTGQPAARTGSEAAEAIGSSVDLVVDAGETPGGIESTIVNLSGPGYQILRPGAISQEAVAEALER